MFPPRRSRLKREVKQQFGLARVVDRLAAGVVPADIIDGELVSAQVFVVPFAKSCN